MDILNDDILIRIFQFLDLEDKIRLRRTCRRWKFLLDKQINQVKALRLGEFQIGAYKETSGLLLKCEHQNVDHRQETGTIFDDKTLQFPADLDTRCFSVKRLSITQIDEVLL